MPKFLESYMRRIEKKMIIVFSVFFLFVLTWYSWLWGAIGWVIWAVFMYATHVREKKFESQFETYISTLSHRLKKVGQDVLHDFPLGILLYDEEQKVNWHNTYVVDLLNCEKESFIGQSVQEVIPDLDEWIQSKERQGVLKAGQRTFHVQHHVDERVLYIQDETDHYALKAKWEQEQPAFMIIHLDNLEEVTQGLDEQQRTLLMNDVIKILNQWTQKMGIFTKRTNVDKFFGILTNQTLRQLEENKFDFIDQIRDLPSQTKVPITLSIGVGADAVSFLELGEMAQSSLDIALGRGGDQVAVKRGEDKITFYGGKSDAIEKRTRVRARVISHALRNIIQASDQVFIMGHRVPDLDAIGSAIGVMKAVQANDRQGYIILNEDEKMTGIEKLMHEVRQDPALYEHFIPSSKALELKTDQSTLVTVDVHKPSMVIEPKLVDHLAKRIVIDHHRRGEEFIPDPLLKYMEPYASSTSELVTELLEYQDRDLNLSPLEATAMLAGIYVDTRGFALRTGVRTFEAASYLRLHGADATKVQNLLKEDKEQFVKRMKIVADAELYRNQVAISVAETESTYGQLLLAQAADTMLSLENVKASFVLSERQDGTIAISARSLGAVNVQMVMEQLHGGGHLTHAATQLENISMEDALQWLKEVLDEFLEGGDDA